MKAYKIKHIPTGLYFTPSKGHGNFSRNGKIYSRKPPTHWFNQPIRIQMMIGEKPNPLQKKLIEYFNITLKNGYYFDGYFKVPLDDWTIEEL